MLLPQRFEPGEVEEVDIDQKLATADSLRIPSGRRDGQRVTEVEHLASSKMRSCGFWKRVAAVAAWKAAKLSNRLLNTPLAWNSPTICCQPAAEKPKTGGGTARAALPAGVESGWRAGSSATPSKPCVVAMVGG